MIALKERVAAHLATYYCQKFSRAAVKDAFHDHQHKQVEFALNYLVKTDEISVEWRGARDPWYWMSTEQAALFDKYMSPLKPYFQSRIKT